MSTPPRKRIVLTVIEEFDCPLFNKGDKMVLRLPGVDMRQSSGVCTLALSKFLPVREKIDCGKFKLVLKQVRFRCPRPDNPVVFDVDVVEDPPGKTEIIRRMSDGDTDKSVAQLKTIPIFQPLSAKALERVLEMLRLEHYPKGSTVIEKGEVGTAFYIVFRGVVEVLGLSDRGKTGVITRLKERDCFGEMSLLTGAPISASIRAADEVALLVMEKADFETMCRENPVLAQLFTALLASRLGNVTGRLAEEEAKAFNGKLSVISLVEVVQSLSDGTRSGTLTIRRADEESERVGRIGFRDGRIHTINLGDLVGEEAFYEMLHWAEGEFWLEPNEVPGADLIRRDVMTLLLEGMRRIDEERAGEDESDMLDWGDREAPGEIAVAGADDDDDELVEVIPVMLDDGDEGLREEDVVILSDDDDDDEESTPELIG